MAAKKYSDTMHRVMLEALTHRTSTGRYKAFAPTRTLIALEARGAVEREDDGRSEVLVHWYLTPAAVTYLREALTIAMGQSAEERGAVWHEWLTADRHHMNAARSFLGLPADKTDEPPAVEAEPVMYACYTGAHGFGWTRKLCDENAASVRLRIGAARRKGLAVTAEDDGVIRIEGASVTDPGFEGAGGPCPMWLVPQRPAAEDQPCEGCGAESGQACTDLSMCTAVGEQATAAGCDVHSGEPADGCEICAEDAKEAAQMIADAEQDIEDGGAAAEVGRRVLADMGMPSGAHCIANTGESIDDKPESPYAFKCSRCDTVGTLVYFERAKCTPKAERDRARERADSLLNDVTFKGATAYEITSPDRFSGEPSTRTVLRGEAREALALWLDAGAPHAWYTGELRVRCFQADHSIRPVVTVGAVIRTGADSVTLSREPWRGGQICGHQTAYGMGAHSERYCGQRKAPGLVECAAHAEETGMAYGVVKFAVGNAKGDPAAPLVLLWEPQEGTEPVEPTEEERAMFAAATAADGGPGVLPFRTVERGTTAREFDQGDDRVNRCERCGGHGFLARDWSDVAAPALCIACHESGGTQQASSGHQCEDWCGLSTEHDGLCAPGNDDLEEMGTDELLTVLREEAATLPADGRFARAWAAMDRILTDGGIECLPAPWDGYGDHAPEGADFDMAASLNARFLPQDPYDENTRPCVEVGTAVVTTYRKDGALRVDVATDGVDTEGPEGREDGTVPMEISVNGRTVFEDRQEGPGDVVTLTAVVRTDGTEGDPCDVMLHSHPDVLFVGHEDGVTATALALGAEPGSWS